VSTATPSQYAEQDLWQWSAAAIAEAIRSRQISSVDAVEACLGRVDQVNPAVNALVNVTRERALDAARAADGRLAGGAASGVLHGVPISIKDNVDEAGLPNTGGVVAAADAIANRDAPVVANLRAAGAISVGRSNVPAFSLRWFSDNELHGRTLNPWDPGRTPGGSSGGAAAAVATGMVPIAHGNDIGGSVRYPAHVCGVMGLRPTIGRVPYWVGPTAAVPGQLPAWLFMSVQGVLARSVADLDLGLQAIAQPDLRDPSCVPAPFTRETALPRGARLGVYRGGPGAPVDEAHHAALDQAAQWLREAGFEIAEVEVPQLAEAHRLWFLLLLEDVRVGRLDRIRTLGDAAINRAVDNYYEVLAEMWGTPDLEAYLGGHLRRTVLIAEVQELLASLPVIVTPASGVLTPDNDADLHPDTAGRLIAGQWPSTSVPVLGLPGLTVPTGVHDGLPIGVQLVGGRYRESWLLDAAAAIEASAPPLTPIDPR
jgi:amidase